MKAVFVKGNLPELFEVMSKFVVPGKRYIMTLEQERTPSQNKYYQAVVIPIFSDITGYSKKRAHNILAGKFNEGRTTTELTTVEFERYLNDCRLFIHHELNGFVPMPQKVTGEMLMELDKIYNF